MPSKTGFTEADFLDRLIYSFLKTSIGGFIIEHLKLMVFYSHSKTSGIAVALGYVSLRIPNFFLIFVNSKKLFWKKPSI